ncbi:MAG: methylated-DNA--[protein]-cysteine S-methyltransferase, partial [Candidatus Peribacteraceae bacterium]|nr:methylated-DNA--[protein]-cysteine S-methyltransferase [Candidatus Peribacteraceae bacterium]
GISSISFLESHPEEIESHDQLTACIDQLREYFEGKRSAFDSMALRYPATDFQVEVWNALMEVPFGQTLTYGELAERAGHKGASRAVGTAMNLNPLPIIIPCHRVLPSSGDIGEYASGSHRKEWLLRHENVAVISG